MWIKPLQIYKPSNKHEVRLVYRVDTPEGKSRHQKSYSIRRHGLEGAWALATNSFHLLKTGSIPDDFPLPVLTGQPQLSPESLECIARLPWHIFALPQWTYPYYITVVEGAPAADDTLTSMAVVGCPVKLSDWQQPPPPACCAFRPGEDQLLETQPCFTNLGEKILIRDFFDSDNDDGSRLGSCRKRKLGSFVEADIAPRPQKLLRTRSGENTGNFAHE